MRCLTAPSLTFAEIIHVYLKEGIPYHEGENKNPIVRTILSTPIITSIVQGTTSIENLPTMQLLSALAIGILAITSVVADCNHNNCLHAFTTTTIYVLNPARRDHVFGNALDARQALVIPTAIPEYVFACTNAVAYSSACYCVGAVPVTTYAPTPISYTTVSAILSDIVTATAQLVLPTPGLNIFTDSNCETADNPKQIYIQPSSCYEDFDDNSATFHSFKDGICGSAASGCILNVYNDGTCGNTPYKALSVGSITGSDPIYPREHRDRIFDHGEIGVAGGPVADRSQAGIFGEPEKTSKNPRSNAKTNIIRRASDGVSLKRSVCGDTIFLMLWDPAVLLIPVTNHGFNPIPNPTFFPPSTSGSIRKICESISVQLILFVLPARLVVLGTNVDPYPKARVAGLQALQLEEDQGPATEKSQDVVLVKRGTRNAPMECRREGEFLFPGRVPTRGSGNRQQICLRTYHHRRIGQGQSYEPSADISREDTARSLLAISTQHNADFVPVNQPRSNVVGQPPARTRLTIAPEVSKRLFQTYFDSIHPMWPLLYKPLYTSLDYTYPSPGIPAPLVMAIFAIASCVDRAQYSGPNVANGSQASLSYPKPKVFFEEALNLLEQGGSAKDVRQPVTALKPSIATCQVLVILALQQHGVAEYQRAAMLCGLASAMAIELHLHRVFEADDPTEREIRSRLWWNLYILEKMLSGEMGRPIVLRYEETDCTWPQISESDEFDLMPLNSHNQKSPASTRNIKMRTMSALHTTISLSIIMERIYRQIYGLSARKAIREDQAAGDRTRMKLWNQLQEWERDMDASALKLDMSDELTSVPAAITNYVIMWTGTIMLHRPFIARWRKDLKFSEPSSDPFQICLDAATQICTVLEKYLERLPGGPCDMVFSIFIAASILLHHSKQADAGAAAETRHRLKLCIHWLSVLGKSWKSAGARHQLLNDLFDLPRALQEPNSQETGLVPQANMGQTSLQQKPVDNAASNGAINIVQSAPLPPEDWSFLRDFGDSTDQFFAWDVELRDLLDGQYGEKPAFI
ncbi:hypothetical protein G7Y89_g7143 [Cudoniella acicularis]|uniref:Xylanolytic transcriptional activator regulatory domain-containing protein n=1 Tax=Cudoniella acicularis TaxID=354080 RepID=A0A8H4RJ41_9HELO|nr:hypothetical protein G7Y89_g7143 [Cudoniella acicularis]